MTLELDLAKCLSNILIAVSNNNNPTSPADWSFKRINAGSNGNWADYPGFEVDEEVIYITANMFTCIGNKFQNSKLFIVQKGTLSSSFFEFFENRTLFPEFTYQPAEVRASTGAGANIGTYLVSMVSENPQSLSIVQIQNPTTSVSFDKKIVPLGTINFATDQLQAPQLGSTKTLASGDARILDNVWNQNLLWVVASVLPVIGGEVTAIWIQVDVSNWATSGPSIKQVGYINGDDISANTHTFYPSVAVNKYGVAAFGFSASGPNINAGAYFTWRRPSDITGTTRASETVKSGVAPYFLLDGNSLNRWGDYTGISVDPLDENCFWVYNQFADKPCRNNTVTGESGCWTTAWAQYCIKTDPGWPLRSPSTTLKPFKSVKKPKASKATKTSKASKATQTSKATKVTKTSKATKVTNISKASKDIGKLVEKGKKRTKMLVKGKKM